MKLKTPQWWYRRDRSHAPVTRLLLKPLGWAWAAETARRIKAAVPVDPHAPVLDRASIEADQHRDTARHLLADAHAHHVITALEYQTLAVLYLQRPGTLHATTSAVERRAQRAIRKLATRYRRAPIAA